MKVYFFDKTGERDAGFRQNKFINLADNSFDGDGPFVLIVHFSDYNSFCELLYNKRESVPVGTAAGSIVLFISGDPRIANPATSDKVKSNLEKYLNEFLGRCKVFYFKVDHGPDSVRVLDDYISYVRTCLEEKKFDEIKSPQEFYTPAKAQDKLAATIFMTLLKSYLLLTSPREKIPVELLNLLKEPIGVCNAAFWQPFVTVMGGRKPEKIFVKDSTECVCAQKVLGAGECSENLFSDIPGIEEYREKLLSGLRGNNGAA